MNTTDPIADMLTRIRNGMMARHDQVLMPASNLKMELARVLKEEGYIKDYEIVREKPKPADRRPMNRAQPQVSEKPERKEPNFRTMRVWLRYTAKREPVITGIKRVSKPGLRVYKGAEQHAPRARRPRLGGRHDPSGRDDGSGCPAPEGRRRSALLHLVAAFDCTECMCTECVCAGSLREAR